MTATAIVAVLTLVFGAALSASLPPGEVWIGGAVIAAGEFAVAVGAACSGDWAGAEMCAGFGLGVAYGAWRNRPPRNRRRVRKLLGAKARAARARLVAAMPQRAPGKLVPA